MLELGKEWIYENLIIYCDYLIFKKFQTLNKRWYSMLDQQFFRTEDQVRRTSMIRWYRNGLRLFISDNLKSCFNVGFQHGPEYLLYDNGTILEKCLYINGVKDGPSKTFWYNGNIETECNYKNGSLDGIYKVYNENGKLNYEGLYTDGKLENKYNEFENL